METFKIDLFAVDILYIVYGERPLLVIVVSHWFHDVCEISWRTWSKLLTRA